MALAGEEESERIESLGDLMGHEEGVDVDGFAAGGKGAGDEVSDLCIGHPGCELG